LRTISKDTVKERLFDTAFILIGSVLFALSIDLFIVPNLIPMGGVTGISIIINHLFKFPIGTAIIIINIPIFLLGRNRIGTGFAIKSLISMTISSLLVDFLASMPAFTKDTLLASLYGGVIEGAGLGLIFSRGSTTGGIDIVSRLILVRRPHMSIGKMMLIIDVCIVAASALLFQSFQVILYSFITLFASSVVIDKIINGINQAKVAMVISYNHEKLAGEIMRLMQRGVTVLEGKGSYTKQDRPVLLCVIPKHELFELKSIVRRLDPDAFVIFCEATEVLGLGFKTE
jgi:uncharacterized membrane-anchored protein YitT (DUF2179 family)